MGTFSTYDGTELAYHGPSGPDPLICLPGGPMQASSYLTGLPLDDVLRLDLRGTGDSEEAASEGTFDPAQVRSDLNNLDVPTLLLTGALDVSLPPKRAQEYADLFARARLVVQAGAGHFPWVDDPEAFAAAVQRIP